MKYILLIIVILAIFFAVLSMKKIDKEYEYTDINNLNPQVETIANDWCDTHECKG